MSDSPERTAWLPSVRVYPWERDLLERAAAAEQIKVSEYVRATLVAAARRRVARPEVGGPTVIEPAALAATTDRAQIPNALEQIGVQMAELERTRAVLWSRLMAPETPTSNGASGRTDLTAKDVAQLIGSSERFVRAHRHDIGSYGSRKLLRFRESDVLRWMERSRK